MTTYQLTSASCLPAPDVGEQLGAPLPDGTVTYGIQGVPLYEVRPTRHHAAELELIPAAGTRQLHRISRLPNACRQPAPSDPLATFDVFWAAFADNYPFFAAKGIDWRAVRDHHRPKVRPDTTDDELFAILSEMVRPLYDAHVALVAGDRLFHQFRPGTTDPTPAYDQKVVEFIERRDVGGPLESWANGKVRYADLPGRLGLQVASRLTSRPYLAYAKQARNDADDPTRFTRPQPIYVRPSTETRYTGPIALLTSGSSVSAAETFTQAMMGRRPAPVRIGENTQGVFSDVLGRQLPNGWLVGLPNEVFRTRTGLTFDGPGIPPHVWTPVFTEEEFARDQDSAFDRAVALLRR